MRHAKKFAFSLCFTTLLFNNCSGFHALDTVGNFSSSSTAPPGVDPHPEQYPMPMGLPPKASPDTLAPVTNWPLKDAELAKITANFNVDDWIYDDGGDAKAPWNGYDDVGAFRFECKPSHNLYDDPIVYPGVSGASHLHTFFGNTMSNANSTYQSLRTTGNGTCSGGPVNRTAYWFPSMRIDDGDGNDLNDKVIMPDFMTVYYKMSPDQSAMFARGTRFIFGYNMGNPAASTSAAQWKCIDAQGTLRGGSAYASLKELADLNLCQSGDNLSARISAPTCWNGQLDSSDHRSHIVEARNSGLGYSACPVTHPYHFPGFTLIVNWTVGSAGNNEVRNLYLSSDHMPGMNMDAGSTFHTDWFGAWDDNVATEWLVHADADFRTCSGGGLCSGRGMVDPYQRPNPQGYTRIFNPANPRLVDPPVHP